MLHKGMKSGAQFLQRVAVSMGRRNTRLKPGILIFGPDGFVGAS